MTVFRDSQPISRRAFLRHASTWSRRALALSLLPGCGTARRAMASGETERRRARARELGLREIAQSRLHHGPDRFINPFQTGPHGGLWRFLRWKVFSRNRFKDQYGRESVRTLDLDWRPFRE